MSQQSPSWRRVQAFILPLYISRLAHFGYSTEDIELLASKYLHEVTLLDNGELACLICNPWSPFCPDFDRGYEECECEVACDFQTKYRPTKVFQSLQAFVDHRKSKHAKVKELTLFDGNWGEFENICNDKQIYFV